jgi:hypothetical protein
MDSGPNDKKFFNFMESIKGNFTGIINPPQQVSQVNILIFSKSILTIPLFPQKELTAPGSLTTSSDPLN